jgi:HEAT repeat protein
MKRTVLMLAIIIAASFCFSSLYGQSEKLDGKTSRYSLKDPRAAINGITEAKALGTKLAAGDQDAVNTVDDLIKAYGENKRRKDGYGTEIQRVIIQALGELKAARAVDLLCAVLADGKESQELKEVAVEAIGKIGDGKARNALNNYILALSGTKTNDPMVDWVIQNRIKKAQSALSLIH